mmetsp:Transcript_14506/g.35355  ORF Transcript_14506/g.35355 Transcript_14506/m.35355 type:complete len:835 (-) Transcript_14506:98-2602(-)
MRVSYEAFVIFAAVLFYMFYLEDVNAPRHQFAVAPPGADRYSATGTSDPSGSTPKELVPDEPRSETDGEEETVPGQRKEQQGDVVQAGPRPMTMPTKFPTAKSADPVRVWNPTCERWSNFQADIYVPKPLAPSTLAKNEPCDGQCVAVCICGSLRTFFHPKVREGLVSKVLQGFNPGGRTDVIMVVSEEHSAKGGVYVIPKEEQCAHYSFLNVVSVNYVQAGDDQKTSVCRDAIHAIEQANPGKKYDWVMRPRPDALFTHMNLKAKTAKRQIYFRHNQFTITPREFLHNFHWPFNGGEPKFEVDTNLRPEPLWCFTLWRTSTILGKKNRYFGVLAMYLIPNICGPCGRGNVERTGPTTKLIRQAQEGNADALVRLRTCLHGMFSMACHNLRHHFDESPNPSSGFNIRGLMQEVNDLATNKVTDHGRLEQLIAHLNTVGEGIMGEMMSTHDDPSSWMPALQAACDKECNPNFQYSGGQWRWGCLGPKLLESPAMRWHPPAFASDEPNKYGECELGGDEAPASAKSADKAPAASGEDSGKIFCVGEDGEVKSQDQCRDVCANAMIEPSWVPHAPLPSGLSLPERSHVSPGEIKRVAVQLTGHIRETVIHVRNLEPLKRVVTALRQNYETVDIFFHTWSKLEADTPVYYKKDENLMKMPVQESVKKLTKELNIKVVLVEDQAATKLLGNTDPKVMFETTTVSYIGMKYQFHGIEAASWMRRCQEASSGKPYDLVIRLRPDVYRIGPNDANTLITVLKSTRPECVDPTKLHGNHDNPGSGAHRADVFLWSTPDVYDNIFSYIHKEFDAIYEHRTHRPPQMVLQALLDKGVQNAGCLFS